MNLVELCTGAAIDRQIILPIVGRSHFLSLSVSLSLSLLLRIGPETSLETQQVFPKTVDCDAVVEDWRQIVDGLGTLVDVRGKCG
jgi:hypothetical protein